MIKTVNELPESEVQTKSKFQGNLPWVFGRTPVGYVRDELAGYGSAGECLRYETHQLSFVDPDENGEQAIRYKKVPYKIRGLHIELKSLRTQLAKTRSEMRAKMRQKWRDIRDQPNNSELATRWRREPDGFEFRKEVGRWVKTGQSKLEARDVTLKGRWVTWIKREPTRIKVNGQWRVRKIKTMHRKWVVPKVKRVLVVPIRRYEILRPAGVYQKWRKVIVQYTRYHWDDIRAAYQTARRDIEAQFLPKTFPIEERIQAIQSELRELHERPKRMVAYTTHGCTCDSLAETARIQRACLSMSDVFVRQTVDPGSVLGTDYLCRTQVPELVRGLVDGGGWSGSGGVFGRNEGGVFVAEELSGDAYKCCVANPVGPVGYIPLGYPWTNAAIQEFIDKHSEMIKLETTPGVEGDGSIRCRGDSITVVNGGNTTTFSPNDLNRKDDTALGAEVAMFENLTTKSDYTFHYIRSMAEAQENKELVAPLIKDRVTPGKFFRWLKGKTIAELKAFSKLPVYKKFYTGGQKLAGLYLLDKFAIEPTLADANTLINGVFDQLVEVRKALHKLLTESGIPPSSILHMRRRFKAEDYSVRIRRFDVAQMPLGIWERYKSVELNLHTSIEARLKVVGFTVGNNRSRCYNFLGQLAPRARELGIDVVSEPYSFMLASSASSSTNIACPGVSLGMDFTVRASETPFEREYRPSVRSTSLVFLGNMNEYDPRYTTRPGVRWAHGNSPLDVLLRSFSDGTPKVASVECSESKEVYETATKDLSRLLPTDETLPVPIIGKNEVHGVIFGQYQAEDLLRLMGVRPIDQGNSTSQLGQKTTDEMTMLELLDLTDEVLDNFYKRLDLVFIGWQLYPLSFVFDWLFNSADIANRINALFQGRLIDTPPRSKYGTWVTKKCELYLGSPELTCYYQSAHKWFSEFRTIPVSDTGVAVTPKREEIIRTWRFKPVTGQTVNVMESGLKKVIRGPYSTDALSILRESLPVLQVKLDSGKLTTLAAMLLG